MSIIMNKARRRDGIAGAVHARASALPRKGASFAQQHRPGETAMTHLIRQLALPAILALLGAGCATPQSSAAAYEQALGQWQGASEDDLRARWGTPVAQEQAGHGKWLTYVVNSGAVPAPTMSFSIGGFGFGGGGHTSVGGGVGVTTPVGQATPITCTTRFLVENGKVSTWTFDGPGCGAAG
jgi:hypothetical protein